VTSPVIDARTAPLEEVLEAAARTVFGGGLLIFPTDTVYGVGCDPYDAAAVARIYGAKHRPGSKPLTFHLASAQEFLEYAREDPLAIRAARRLLPGPVTLIIRKPHFVSEQVTAGLQTLGFRVPDDPLCRAILERCGPLAATSANRSGEQAYRGDGDYEGLPEVDLIVENGPTRYRRESSVVDLTGPRPRLLRAGVLDAERLSEALGVDVLAPAESPG
jgi:L-threonylcarbamoyladenylate synthase